MTGTRPNVLSEELLFAGVIITLLASYAFLDGIFVYLSAAQLGIYGLIAAVAAGTALVAVFRGALSKRNLGFIVAWIVISGFWLLPALVAKPVYIVYLAGDFAGIVLPLLLLICGLRYRALFTSPTLLGVFFLAAFAAAILAVPMAEVISRHEPPSTILLALVWAAFFTARSRTLRRASAVVLVLLLFLAWNSSERTAVLMWVALGTLGRAFLVERLRNLLWAGLGVLALLAVVIVAFGQDILVALAATRLESLAQGELDVSLLNRVLEVQDVWAQWSMAEWFGLGHGATYLPEYSYPMRNLTAEGRVHHVHFGPALLLYRYGLPGVLLYLWIIADTLLYVVRMNRVRFRVPYALPKFFFALGLLGYLASFLVFNIIPDPAFSYVLAGYLCLRLTGEVPVPGYFVSDEWTNSQANASS